MSVRAYLTLCHMATDIFFFLFVQRLLFFNDIVGVDVKEFFATINKFTHIFRNLHDHQKLDNVTFSIQNKHCMF